MGWADQLSWTKRFPAATCASANHAAPDNKVGGRPLRDSSAAGAAHD